MRKALEKHRSMRAVSEYEVKYVNAAGYWAAFHQAAIDIRQEKVTKNKIEDAKRMEVWAVVAVRYCLRTLGLRTEFYKMASDDLVHAKLVLPIIEKRTEVAAADDLDKAMSDMLSHNTTQMMKAVATLQASNAAKRVQNPGGPGRKWIIGMTRRRTLWHGIKSRVEAWRRLGAPERLCRALQFGI